MRIGNPSRVMPFVISIILAIAFVMSTSSSAYGLFATPQKNNPFQRTTPIHILPVLTQKEHQIGLTKSRHFSSDRANLMEAPAASYGKGPEKTPGRIPPWLFIGAFLNYSIVVHSERNSQITATKLFYDNYTVVNISRDNYSFTFALSQVNLSPIKKEYSHSINSSYLAKVDFPAFSALSMSFFKNKTVPYYSIFLSNGSYAQVNFTSLNIDGTDRPAILIHTISTSPSSDTRVWIDENSWIILEIKSFTQLTNNIAVSSKLVLNSTNVIALHGNPSYPPYYYMVPPLAIVVAVVTFLIIHSRKRNRRETEKDDVFTSGPEKGYGQGRAEELSYLLKNGIISERFYRKEMKKLKRR